MINKTQKLVVAFFCALCYNKTKNVKWCKKMEQEKKYYLAVFQAAKKEKLFSNNAISLLQFADVHCKTTGETGEMHQQWCNEITFVYSGQGDIVHNGIKIPVKSGQIHFCPKDAFHQIIPSKHSPMRFFCMGFELDNENSLLETLNRAIQKIENSQNPVISDCADLIVPFETALNALYENEKDETTNAVAVNSINYIITSVCKRFIANMESTSNISAKESLLFYIISYLKNNVYNINALKNLSVDMGYSYPYLSHMFSEKMGQSLKTFFTTLRMNQATELLKNKNVTEVSEILGYSSLHAFSRAYKQFCDKAPSTAKEKNDKDITKYI